jgi:hypothetical protein
MVVESLLGGNGGLGAEMVYDGAYGKLLGGAFNSRDDLMATATPPLGGGGGGASTAVLGGGAGASPRETDATDDDDDEDEEDDLVVGGGIPLQHDPMLEDELRMPPTAIDLMAAPPHANGDGGGNANGNGVAGPSSGNTSSHQQQDLLRPQTHRGEGMQQERMQPQQQQQQQQQQARERPAGTVGAYHLLTIVHVCVCASSQLFQSLFTTTEATSEINVNTV